MATKQRDPKDEAFGKAPVPEEMVVTPPQEAIPVQPASQPVAKIVPVGNHDLSDDETRRVAQIRQLTDSLVKYYQVLRDSYHDAEVQRALSVAITEVQTAGMWATRAVTWRG